MAPTIERATAIGILSASRLRRCDGGGVVVGGGNSGVAAIVCD